MAVVYGYARIFLGEAGEFKNKAIDVVISESKDLQNDVLNPIKDQLIEYFDDELWSNVIDIVTAFVENVLGKEVVRIPATDVKMYVSKEYPEVHILFDLEIE